MERAKIHTYLRFLMELGKFRHRRMRQFYEEMQPSASSHILDVGGKVDTWTTESGTTEPFRVTLLNLDSEQGPNPSPERFLFEVGDARSLVYEDGSFSTVFSNSVIEHVGDFEQQARFASELRRVGDRLWVQTPAFSFPVEPHLIAPFIHWLPRSVQQRLVRHFTFWGWVIKPTPQEVKEMLDGIRLLSLAEFRQLFPDCRIRKERLFGITKSYVAVR